MLKFTVALISLLMIQSAYSFYCGCEQIQTESQCICKWYNGKCHELTCQQRKQGQVQCEPDYGNYWCAWVNGSQCQDPRSCEDISIKKWCKRSGCNWISSGNEDESVDYDGVCVGTLNSISCKNLNSDSCYSYSYFYNYGLNNYEYCELDKNGNCFGIGICGSMTEKINCSTNQFCEWSDESELCELRKCENIKDEAECSFIYDDYNLHICEWKDNACSKFECSQISSKDDCTNTEEQIYGYFCEWKNGACKDISCSQGTNESQCLHETYTVSEGWGSCTWVADQGICTSCNATGPILPEAEKTSSLGLILGSVLLSLILG